MQVKIDDSFDKEGIWSTSWFKGIRRDINSSNCKILIYLLFADFESTSYHFKTIKSFQNMILSNIQFFFTTSDFTPS